MKRLIGALTLGCCALAFAGCGGESESEREKQAEKAGRGTITCEGSALSGALGLPAGFPKLAGTTYVKSVEQGPSRIVEGYSTESLDDLYESVKSGFEDAGYTVLFDELEEDDSEVSYRTKDGRSEGQVALRAACDNGNVSVHITNRPA